MNRIIELEKLITDANKKYWIENNPEISDYQYDEYVEELRKLDPKNSLLTQLVSASSSSSENKIIHSKPMLSLDKVYDIDNLMKWINKVSRSDEEVFVIQPKYDGLSGKIENGKLSSRGDGKIGLDYTDKLSIIKFILSEKNKNFNKSTDELLGEMLISNKDWNSSFKSVTTKSGIPFKNQRNAAAGIIGTDDIDFYRNQNVYITFVDYDTINFSVTAKEFKSKWESIIEKIQKVEYPMDGIVIKLHDKDYYDSLGNTEHHPRGAIAYKYTNKSKWSKLIGVQWSIGKDQIACVGQIEPIDISGTTIKNVKLQLTKPISSSVQTYVLNGSLQIGDEVLIERAGDIIPHVIQSKPGSNREVIKIEKCPFCGEEIVIDNSSVKCSNKFCPEREVQQLYYSMITLGFKGIGEVYARNLHDLLNVKTLNDLMCVTREQLEVHQCFGKKLIDIFLSEREKISKCSFEQFLVSLNIDNLGKSVSKLLVQEFQKETILNGLLTYSDLIKVKGIGKIAAEAVSSGLRTRSEEIKKSACHFTFKNSEKKIIQKYICFTGKMVHTRSEMEKIAVSRGLTPVDHIDKSTSYLVCADLSSNSSKMQKAKKLGCKIISEKNFLENSI